MSCATARRPRGEAGAAAAAPKHVGGLLTWGV
jgi:hypothetical protein